MKNIKLILLVCIFNVFALVANADDFNDVNNQTSFQERLQYFYDEYTRIINQYKNIRNVPLNILKKMITFSESLLDILEETHKHSFGIESLTAEEVKEIGQDLSNKHEYMGILYDYKNNLFYKMNQNCNNFGTSVNNKKIDQGSLFDNKQVADIDNSENDLSYFKKIIFIFYNNFILKQ